MLVQPLDFLLEIAGVLAAYFIAEPGKVHLYTNDISPGLLSTVSDFEETLWSGYAPIDLPAGFTVSPVDLDTVALIQWDLVTFSNPDALTYDIFGYFIAGGSSELYWAERFATAPITIPAGPDGLFSILPRFRYLNET